MTSPGPYFGLQLADYTFDGVGTKGLFDAVVERVRTAERVGFNSALAVDHFQQIAVNGPPRNAMFEPYSLLAALAPHTSTIRLGALVSPVTYRSPASLIKTVSSLDVISGGRAIMGLGAGWNEAEHRAYGIDFPPLAQRFERLEECLRIMSEMFASGAATFHGSHYRLEEAVNFPAPIQPGGPQILIGGGGERKTLRLVASYAHICHLMGGDPAEVMRKLDVLASHCLAVGRDPAEILKTTIVSVVIRETPAEAAEAADRAIQRRIDGNRRMGLSLSAEAIRGSLVFGDPAQVADKLAAYVAAGVDGFTVSNWFLRSPEDIALFGEVIKIMRR